MRKLSQQEIEDFLARPIDCRLGCLDEEGYPYVVPCTYLYADGGFYLSAREHSAWGRHLARDGRCSLVIDVGYREPRVQVQGVATLLEGPRLFREPWDDDPMFQLGVRMFTRYAGSEEAARQGVEGYRAEPFWWFFVRPHRLTAFRGGDWAARYKHADRKY